MVPCLPKIINLLLQVLCQTNSRLVSLQIRMFNLNRTSLDLWLMFPNNNNRININNIINKINKISLNKILKSIKISIVMLIILIIIIIIIIRSSSRVHSTRASLLSRIISKISKLDMCHNNNSTRNKFNPLFNLINLSHNK